MIAKTRSALDDAHSSAVEQLLGAKRKVEHSDLPVLEDLMTLLFSATQVRRCVGV